MTIPPAFVEPVSNKPASRGRVSVQDVAAAAEKRSHTLAVRESHEGELADFVSENPGHSHHYSQVSFEGLIIDHTIQRPENVIEINNIARDFNPAALGMITISRRVFPATATEPERVELVVIDGQQRRAAALRVGYTGFVHADIHNGLTRADEARLFRQLNNRKAVSQVALFRAALVEEKPEALAVMAILDGLGISFGNPKGYMAASGSQRLVKRVNGVTNLHWALSQVQRLYDRGDGGVYDAAVVEAFFLLYERHGNRINETRLYDRLASDEGSNSGLVEFGKTLKRVHKSNTTVGIIRAIINKYNHNLPRNSRNALPEWE